MSVGTGMPLESGRAIAERLVGLLQDVCERIEIAGSIRRQKAFVNDIELVAIPRVQKLPGQLGLFGERKDGGELSLLDKRLGELIAGGLITSRPYLDKDFRSAWGDRQKKFFATYDGVPVSRLAPLAQVDLFIVRPPAQWGAIFTIRTGPAGFSQALVEYARRHTEYIQDEGALVNRWTLKVVPTPEEADYFQTLGLTWIPPEDRNRADATRRIRQSPRRVEKTPPRHKPPAEPRAGFDVPPGMTVSEYLRTGLLLRAGVE